MLKLKLQYFGHLMRKVDSLEKTDAGRDWGQEEKGMTEEDIQNTPDNAWADNKPENLKNKIYTKISFSTSFILYSDLKMAHFPVKRQ